jgi:Guanine nucleotide exchange factor synembryn
MIEVINNLSDLLIRSSTADHEHFLLGIKQWNELVENEIQNSPSCETSGCQQGNEIIERVDIISHQLLFALLTVLSREEVVLQDQSNKWHDIIPDTSRDFLQQLRSGFSPSDRFDDNSECFLTLRAAQNWLRWCLQIYEPMLVLNKNMYSKSLNKSWRSRDMLETYLRLIIQFAPMSADMGRFSCQLLFYASYNSSLGCGDEIKDSYEYLAQECNLFLEVLRVLVQTDQIRLQLSLIKVIHNSYVCFPSLKANLLEASTDLESLQNPAKWILSSGFPVTIKDACWDLMRNQMSESCESPFPGRKDSRRAELVVEILRVFYAFKVGTELVNVTKHHDVIFDILSLDQRDEQCYECQQCVISLFMDTNPTFSTAVVDSPKAMNVLLYILEHQISLVLSKNLIDERAVSSVIPILVTLNKFCKANLSMRKILFEHLFPLSDEDTYQNLVTKELTKNSGSAKNMSPLHAPKGTLRWKMIQLMTWPQGFVKRTTGEFLWTLCNEDTQHFVLRVGLGNALPFLGIKGVMPIPTSTLMT